MFHRNFLINGKISTIFSIKLNYAFWLIRKKTFLKYFLKLNTEIIPLFQCFLEDLCILFQEYVIDSPKQVMLLVFLYRISISYSRSLINMLTYGILPWFRPKIQKTCWTIPQMLAMQDAKCLISICGICFCLECDVLEYKHHLSSLSGNFA